MSRRKVHLVEPLRPGSDQYQLTTRCGRYPEERGLEVKRGSRNDREAMTGVTCVWCRWGRDA